MKNDDILKSLLFVWQAVVVTNTILQEEHMKLCPKLRVIDVSMMFAGLFNLRLTYFIPTFAGTLTLSYL
jgi:phosphoribosylpyrophosphate synthetase